MGKACIYTKSSEQEWVHIFQLLKVESGPGERLCVMTGLRRGGRTKLCRISVIFLSLWKNEVQDWPVFPTTREGQKWAHRHVACQHVVKNSWVTPFEGVLVSVRNFSTERKVARPNKPSVLFDEDTRLAQALHLFSAATITSEHNLGGLEQGKLSLCPCRRPEAYARRLPVSVLPQKALKTTPSSSHPAILALFDLETHRSQSLLPSAHGFVPSFSLLIRTASLEDRPTMSQYDLQTPHLQVKSRLQVSETRDENKEWSLSGCSGNPKQRLRNCTLGRPGGGGGGTCFLLPCYLLQLPGSYVWGLA